MRADSAIKQLERQYGPFSVTILETKWPQDPNTKTTKRVWHSPKLKKAIDEMHKRAEQIFKKGKV
jgi:hypothetical protein